MANRAALARRNMIFYPYLLLGAFSARGRLNTVNCSTVLVAIKGVNGLTVSIKLAVDVYSSTMLTAWVVILLPLSSKILMQTKKECGRWLWLRQGT